MNRRVDRNICQPAFSFRIADDSLKTKVASFRIYAIFNGSPFWQVNYGPKDYIGQRGGDLIIEIDSGDASIQKVLWGQ